MYNEILNWFPKESLNILSEDEVKDLGVLSGRFIQDRNNPEISIPLEGILEKMNVPLQAYSKFLDQISKMEFNDKDLNKYFESNPDAYNENTKINRNGKLYMSTLATVLIFGVTLAAKCVAEKHIDANVKMKKIDITKDIIESGTKILTGGLLGSLLKK